MYNFIFLLGSQGSGKTTIARLLKEKLGSPYVDYDWIRGSHLNKDWSNTSDPEAKMSLENLAFLLKNYKKNNYENIIVSGFTQQDIEKILNEFKDDKYIVITLFLTENEVLKQRVLTDSRDSGFRDFEQSIQFNKKLKEELKFPNEHKIDNTHQTPEETVNQIIDLLS